MLKLSGLPVRWGFKFVWTRAVRRFDYNPVIALAEEKDKLVTENWRDKGRNNRMNKYEQPDFNIHNTLNLFFMFGCFNILCLAVLENNVIKNLNVWTLERKISEEIKGSISSSNLIAVYTIHPLTLNMCNKFRMSRTQRFLRKVWWKILIFENWRERKIKKGWISSSSLFVVYTLHPPIVHVCTNFQLSRTHNSWEKCYKILTVWKLEWKKN